MPNYTQVTSNFTGKHTPRTETPVEKRKKATEDTVVLHGYFTDELPK